MRRLAVAIVFALLLPCPSVTIGERIAAPTELPFTPSAPEGESPLVVEVYYNTLRADEHVVLANPAPRDQDLGGWSLTDGEGTLRFPEGARLAAGSRVVIAQNATAYEENTLRTADFAYTGPNASMARSGTFRLNNDGDEVLLRDPEDRVVDVFSFGSSPYAGAGWSGPAAAAVGQGLVARRDHEGTWRDSNTAMDWDLVRVWSLGQSEFSPVAFSFEGEAVAFVSPDAGTAPLLRLLEGARTSIDASLYTLTNMAVGDALADAARRGVRVRVLLEGAPVGGVPGDERVIVDTLAEAGGDIRFLVDDTDRDVQERYRFLHAKYAVIDRETVVVSSENWGASAMPPDGSLGSRGWSLAVTHRPLAAYFTAVYEDDNDLRRRDILPHDEVEGDGHVLPEPIPGSSATAVGPLRVWGPLRVVPVLGPDTTLSDGAILGAIRAATRTIHAQVFYAHPRWDGFPNLYLEELFGAARRGVSVRLLLDATPANVRAGTLDNDDTIDYVRSVAGREALDFEAKLIDLDGHGLLRLHNKGLVIDGRVVLVSSVNWNRNSPTANREAGLLVESQELGAYFESVFAWDWKGDVRAPRADAGPDRTVEVGHTVPFSGLASSDDVGVANHSWDLDGDGAFDAWGPEVAATYAEPGIVPVRLRVMDAEGNADEDVAIVTVVPAPIRDADGFGTVGPALAGLALAGASFALLRRRRKGISKPP